MFTFICTLVKHPHAYSVMVFSVYYWTVLKHLMGEGAFFRKERKTEKHSFLPGVYLFLFIV